MITIEKNNYLIKFDEQKGRIESLIISGKENIQFAMPVFAIGMRDENGNSIKKNTDDFSFVFSEHENNKYAFTYAFEDSFTVIVTILFEDEIKWHIEIKNNTDLCLEYVDFPQITVPNDLKGTGGKAKLLWCYNEGVIIEDIKYREDALEFAYRDPTYPGEGAMGVYPAMVESQLLAYFDGKSGLYMAAHDIEGATKGIDFYSCKNGIKLQFRLFTGCDFGEDYNPDYFMVMKGFEGDWYDAAEIYRSWFMENKPDELKKIAENKDLPAWYGESPIIITYPVRGIHDMDIMNPNRMFPYINGMEHVEKLAEKLNSKILVLLMHWEGSAPWAPPIVWPPYGGEECLKEFIDALHKSGHYLGVYCSGLGWTIQSNLINEYNTEKQIEKENLKTHMCVSPEGNVELSHICQGQRSGYDMCPTEDFTIQTICNEVEKMCSAGIDYIQVLDQNHGGTPYFCYSKNHNHPYAPGIWQTKAMKHLFNEMKKSTHKDGRKVLLGCESAAAEAYIPNLLMSDNRFNISYYLGYPVPLYSYIYHEFVNNFMGNQVCVQFAMNHEENKNDFVMRMAYAFTAGDLITFVLDQDGNITWNWGIHEQVSFPNREDILEFALNANAYRTGAAKKYLFNGKMIKPYVIKTDGTNDFMLKGGNVYKAEKLFTSCWQAQDGKVGQIVSNYNKDKISFKINIENSIEVTNLKTETIRTYTPENGVVSLEIEPLNVILFEEI